MIYGYIRVSTDTQTVFGKGNCNGYVNNASANYNKIPTGTMNTKGMFWGSNVSDTSPLNGVKVFGMENYWANVWERIWRSCGMLFGCYKKMVVSLRHINHTCFIMSGKVVWNVILKKIGYLFGNRMIER